MRKFSFNDRLDCSIFDGLDSKAKDIRIVMQPVFIDEEEEREFEKLIDKMYLEEENQTD